MEYDKNRFTFKPYKGIHSKIACPKCHKPHKFVQYIDKLGKVQFPDDVGYCERKDSCGYRKTPYEYFKESGFSPGSEKVEEMPQQEIVFSYTPVEVMEATLKGYEINSFVAFLKTKFPVEVVENVIRMYKIGTSKHKGGCTIFWYVDAESTVRQGKVIRFQAKNDNIHREKWATNVHSLLKWKDYRIKQTLFGLHLLHLEEMKSKPIAIVEAEKTAIIASICMPEYLWLASGGMGFLNVAKCSDLKNRQITLFPDLGKGFETWSKVCDELKYMDFDIEISDYLEQIASEEERQKGLDIADYLLKMQIEKTKQQKINEMLSLTPTINLLIQKFNCSILDVQAL